MKTMIVIPILFDINTDYKYWGFLLVLVLVLVLTLVLVLVLVLVLTLVLVLPSTFNIK